MSKSKDSHHGKVPLDKHIISQFAMAKVFKYQNCSVNGLDIDNSGRYLVTTSTDNCVRLYDCLDAKLRKTIECKKYGASNIQFTHHSKSVLLASHNGLNSNTTNNCHNVIRYLSLHDNAYIRTFYGHTDKITQIHLCYMDDSFMTASLDRHIRLWDLRDSGCVAICKVSGRPTVAADPEGLVFGIGTGNNELKLYDRRKYQHGPFTTIKTFPKCNYEWVDMKFSPDGKYILVSTRTNMLMLIDSIDGHFIQSFVSYKNTTNEDMIGSFTPNGKFIACGSSNGDIHFWSFDKVIKNWERKKGNTNRNKYSRDNDEDTKVAVWKGHPRSIKFFQWNPKYLTAVSASQHVSLWLPRSLKQNTIKQTVQPKKSSLRKRNYNNSNNKK